MSFSLSSSSNFYTSKRVILSNFQKCAGFEKYLKAGAHYHYISSLHSADELQQERNSCPLLRSCFIGSCHVGVSKQFSSSISLAVFCFDNLKFARKCSHPETYCRISRALAAFYCQYADRRQTASFPGSSGNKVGIYIFAMPQQDLISQKNNVMSAFSCVYPDIDNAFRHNIIKVVCGSTRLSPMGRQMCFYYLEWLFVYNQSKYG